MLWIKTFHILAVISWMAGIFYLPRIFVHYAEGTQAGEGVRRLVIMAAKLFSFMTLMGIFVLIFGLWLWLGYCISGNWLYVKLIFVLCLSFYHGICWYYLQQIKSGRLNKSGRFFRWFNEIPLFLLVLILIFVVVKPI